MPIVLLNRSLLAACIMLNTLCTIAVLVVWLISVKPSDVRKALAESEARARTEVITNRQTINEAELQLQANKEAIEELQLQSIRLHEDIRRLLVTLVEKAESK